MLVVDAIVNVKLDVFGKMFYFESEAFTVSVNDSNSDITITPGRVSAPPHSHPPAATLPAAAVLQPHSSSSHQQVRKLLT